MPLLAGVVITYQPDNTIYHNIATYLSSVDRLYLVDNSEPMFNFDKDLIDNSKVVLIQQGRNDGIALRLNQVAKLAIADGFDWLLTMDQDSYFEAEHLSAYFEYAEQYPDKDVAMFGVESNNPQELIADFSEHTNILITSGSLLNLHLFTTIGGFDENLFIDEVDHEYCYRATLNGYKILKFTHIYLHHKLGEAIKVRTLKGTHKTTSLHSPLRLYYMARNYLYLCHKYKPAFEKDLKNRGVHLMHHIKNNLFYGPDKTKLLKMLYAAYLDYKKGEMGKKRT